MNGIEMRTMRRAQRRSPDRYQARLTAVSMTAIPVAKGSPRGHRRLDKRA